MNGDHMKEMYSVKHHKNHCSYHQLDFLLFRKKMESKTFFTDNLQKKKLTKLHGARAPTDYLMEI